MIQLFVLIPIEISFANCYNDLIYKEFIVIKPAIYLVNQQLDEICRQLTKQSVTWFENRGIKVVQKNGFELLSRHGVLNHWNVLTNGLMSRNYKIFSVPWFNLFEMDSPYKTDYNNCWLIEDLESVQIHVNILSSSVHKLDFMVNTDTEIDSLEHREIIENVSFNPQHFPTTWTFQVDKNYSISLVSARYKKTLFEETEEDLDYCAEQMKVKRPKRFKITHGIEEIKEKIKIESNDDTKWFVRDFITGARSEIEFRLERPNLLANNTYRRLLDPWKKEDDWRVRRNFPRSRKKYDEVDSRLNNIVVQICSETMKWQEKNLNQQELWKQLEISGIPAWKRKIIMSLQSAHKEKWSEIIKIQCKKLGIKTIMDVFNLSD